MSGNKAKRIAVRHALLVVSIAISATIAETVLRYIFPLDVQTVFDHRIPHPDFGWVLEPGASFLNKIAEDTVRVTYNSEGWRDAEHSVDIDRKAFRVLVLGDSFMEGYSVELEDSFHRQLERLGRKDGIDMEVINFGVGGYGTLQEYLVFEEVGKRYNPDLVLLGFFVENDVRNNSI